ncbi:hypothetical protein F511_32103 [Dorcoceras hygrometricum]|uniref:Dystroglycan-like n=1 Tax=Dorcoceras hygrometricum TaxID=472368 RepID=A0A2Z7CRI7_9LAMI|nr:hypothetical protein F511_32103 [Dorcoceras hygrometricum]
MKNSFAYVSITVGRCSIKKTALLVSSSRYMFRGNSDACVIITVELLRTTKIALLTSLHLSVYKGNRSAYVSIADRGLQSLHSQMASTFITYSYQINFESVLLIHDNEGMVNMFKALEASGLRRFLGCESTLYESELGHFFDTASIQDGDITCVISGKSVSISPSMFTTVFDLPSEGITNFAEVPKEKVYDARSFFSQKGVQVDVHGKKKFLKHEFRLLNDILAKAITVKAGSFDSVTVERFQMMTAIHYGLKVNWGHVLFNVLKDMVDKSQKKAKGFAAQIGALLKSIPAVTMSNGVSFPSAKVLSMRTVHTYIVTNTTIDARTESEEPGMAKTPKGKKKHSSAAEKPVDVFAEFTASKKSSATAADAPIITKKRRTGKSKPSVSQAKMDIVQVATDVEPIQVVDPTLVEETVPLLVLKRKSRKRKLVLSWESDDDSVGTEDISKKGDDVVVMSTVEADIAKVLEETLALGVTETVQESQAFDEALFEEDFTRWLDDFIARHTEPEVISTNIGAQATGSTTLVIDKEVPMSIDDLLIQISNDLLLPVTAAEVAMLRIGAFSSSGDKGKAKLGEDEQVTDNAARKLFALICRDVEVLVQVRDHLMQAVVDFFASFSLNSMPDMDSLKELKEKERLMLAWAETNTLAIAVRRQLYVLAKYRELLLRTVLESYQRYLTSALPWNAVAVQVANLLSGAHSTSIEELKALQQELNIELVESHSSLPAMDYTDSGDVRFAHFYSIANSSCWVRPVMLINEVWTPVQGPEFWSNSCSVSLFLDNLHMPSPAIQKLFVPLNSFIAPNQYWATVPYLMRIWHWTKVCEEVVEFNLSGGLRPVRKDASHAITVHNLGVERIPADFLRLFAQGLTCNYFADSVCQKDLGDIEEVASTGVEEVDLVSSDVSTVYRSPSPPSPGVDSFEHDLRFALGPAIFSRTEQEERLYSVQIPDSPPAVSPLHESSSSSADVSLNFDSTDVPVHAPAAPHAPTSVDSTKLAEVLEDLQSSLTQRILTSNSEMFSKLNAVEMGIREDLFKMQTLLRQSFETACRVLERQSNTHTAQITDLKKGLMGPDQIAPSAPAAGNEATNVQPDDNQSDVAQTKIENPDVAQEVASDSPLVSRPTPEVPAASISSSPAGQPGASTSYHSVLRPTAGQPVTRPPADEPVASTSHQLEVDAQSNNAQHQLASADPAIANQPATQGEQGANPFGLDLWWNKNHPPEQVIDMMTSAVNTKLSIDRYDDVTSADICKWMYLVYRDKISQQQGTVHSSSSRKDLTIEKISGASVKKIQIRSYTHLEKIDDQNKNHSYRLKLRRRDKNEEQVEEEEQDQFWGW